MKNFFPVIHQQMGQSW